MLAISKPHHKAKTAFWRTLLILTSIYGLLYLFFIVVGFIPNPDGSPVGGATPYDPFDLEGIIVKLLFVVFLVGYIVSWRSDGMAGLIFILWYAGMWSLELFYVARIRPGRGGGGIAMGLPIFILGILFVASWRKSRHQS